MNYTVKNENMQGFTAICDEIVTQFHLGSLWHRNSAMCMRKGAFRGFGELHKRMSEHDFCKMLCFDKVIADRIKHMPVINTSDSGRASAYVFEATPQGIKEHFAAWLRREQHYEQLLNGGIDMSRSIKLAIYDELCCIQKSVQEEIFRVEVLTDRLDVGGWSGHDVAYVSELYHKHFENGGGMDITLS
ncbi:MAG: hypothetical protein FWG90_05110 [Oscillospiraceae bacterium]|nr:hypothetical protein [Oscillospiraceae bacterium]